MEGESKGALVVSLSLLDSKLAGLSIKVRECARKLSSIEDFLKERYASLLKELEGLEDEFVSALIEEIEKNESLSDDIMYRVEMERRVLEGRIRSIKGELAELDEKFEKIRQKLLKEAEEMKKANPKLNELEEELKSRRMELSIKRGKLLIEKDRLGKGIIRRILNRNRIKELSNQIDSLNMKIEEIDREIYKVRMKWLKMKKRWEKKKKEAEKEWAEILVRTAELKQELIFYEENLEKLAKERGARRFILDLIEGYADPNAYGSPLVSKYLKEIERILRRKEELEDAIKNLSFSRKVLLGFDRGIKRFRRPLKALIDEESRFSQLPTLRIDCPSALDSMRLALDGLLIHIEEFEEDSEAVSRAIKPLFDEKGPFSGNSLKNFFDEIGRSVKEAVEEQWR